MRWARLGIGLVLAVAFWVALPARASAHSILVSSQPAAGAELGTTPGDVVLDFSSQLNSSLSRTTVRDPVGHSTTANPTAATEIRVTLVTNVPGLYRVNWTAVSLADGHTLAGTFSFTVLSKVSAAALSTSPGGLTAGDAALSVARWVEDAALLLAIGMLLVRWLGRRDPALQWVKPPLIVPLIVAVVAGMCVISVESLSASGGSFAGAARYFTSGPSEVARIGRILVEGMAIAAVAGGARRLWPAVTAPVIALAAAGHGAAAQPAWWGIGIDAVHLLAAGTWAGGIIALATLRPPGGWRTGGGTLLVRFTPCALTAFGTTISFGVLQAIQDVGDLNALTGSGYGRVLLVKTSLVGLMLPLSMLAWRLRRPHPRFEGGIALMAVGAAALLASFPLPASRLSAAGPSNEAAVTAAVPRGSELTFGGHAGRVLIGLTVDPATAGANQLRIYALSPYGDGASASLAVTAKVDASAVSLASCADTCRSAAVTLHGGEVITVHVDGATSGTTSFAVPHFPMADGAGLLLKAQSRMDALHSYTEHETLTSGDVKTVTIDYTALAPDRLSWTLDSKSSTIWIGPTQYSRATPDAPWVTEPSGVTPSVPGYVWDSFSPYIGVHSLGFDLVDGVPATMVSFFGSSSGLPVWFKLWIDGDGLVHRAEMRAPGHFMDETFSNFNASLTVSTPG